MNIVRNKAAPLMTFMFVVCACLALSGCLSVYEYDPNSHTHAKQANRNVDDINNGYDDAAIDARIEEAWRVQDPEPVFQAEGQPEGTASLEWQEWKARYDEHHPLFYDILRSFAVTDIERIIDKDQSEAWVAYEEAKADKEGAADPAVDD